MVDGVSETFAQQIWQAKILVCGSRTWTNYKKILAKLDEAIMTYFYGEEVLLIHGGARGADELAGLAGVKLRCTVIKEPADWEGRGQAAGILRNQRMLDDYNPDLVLAFVTGSLADSKGTLDMVSRALRKGVMVIAHGE